jgi:hypothetical protein
MTPQLATEVLVAARKERRTLPPFTDRSLELDESWG